MNRAKQITHYKKILETARMLKAAAQAQDASATHLESEAISALEELGVQIGRGQPAKVELSDQQKFELLYGGRKHLPTG